MVSEKITAGAVAHAAAAKALAHGKGVEAAATVRPRSGKTGGSGKPSASLAR
jgi:hypothetical protein